MYDPLRPLEEVEAHLRRINTVAVHRVAATCTIVIGTIVLYTQAARSITTDKVIEIPAKVTVIPYSNICTVVTKYIYTIFS